jgi:hypothetical protein
LVDRSAQRVGRSCVKMNDDWREGSGKIEMIELACQNSKDEERSLSSQSFASALLVVIKPTLKALFASVDQRTWIEFLLCFLIVSAAFAFSTTQFLQEKIDTLVPFESTGGCSKAQQIYTLAPQLVEASYPGYLKYVDYTNPRANAMHTVSQFTASWSSCGKNSFNKSSFGLAAGETMTEIVPVEVKMDSKQRFDGSYDVNVTSADGCFNLFCGFSYSNHALLGTNMRNYLNNTIIFVLPYLPGDIIDSENGSLALGNSQLFASVSTTGSSVSASCGIGLAGTVTLVLTESNTIADSGTYLCTASTSLFQAISSGLSISLTLIGICRVYFAVKMFYEPPLATNQERKL